MVLKKYAVVSPHSDDDASSQTNSNTETASESDSGTESADEEMTASSPQGADDTADPFYDILCQRVAEVLKEDGIDPKTDRGATWSRMLYYVVIFLLWLGTGYHYCCINGTDKNNSTVTSLVQVIAGSFAFALCSWFMGALGHDAGHFAVATSCSARIAKQLHFPYNFNVNEWAVWAMSCIENPILWQMQHTYAHHSFTNEFENDPDLHHFVKFLRVHPQHGPFAPQYGHQTNLWYVVMAYSFVILGTCLWIPLTMLQTGSLYDNMVEWQEVEHPITRYPSKVFGMKLHMVTYMGFIVGLPLYCYDRCWMALIGIAVYMASVGILFAIFSQINHLNHHAIRSDKVHRQGHRPRVLTDLTPSGELDLTTSWAATQIETSNNFATHSWVWFLLSNGLNYQIEHHLFPGLNHCHLWRIAHVVEDTCLEFGVAYRNYESWQDVVGATRTWLAHLGVDAADAGDSDGMESSTKKIN